jgi:hypothetical protein
LEAGTEQAQSVLNVVSTPAVIGQRFDCFQRYFVTWRVFPSENVSGSALRLVSTDVNGLEHCPKRSLGRDGVLLHEFWACTDKTTEILRPRGILGRVGDYMSNLPGAQLLRLWRKPEECIRFSFNEQAHRSIERPALDP